MCVMSRRGSSCSKRKLPPMPTAKELGELECLKQNEVSLKSKIRSLELEVETLKSRLDSLRRAKNTTIVRREREEVRISSPRLGRLRGSTHSLQLQSPSPQHTHTNTSPPHTATPLCQHGDLQDEVDRLNTQLLSLKVSNSRELEELKVSHQREMEEVRRVQKRELEQLNEKHRREITELRRGEDENCQHEDLLSQIEQLRRDNTDLSEKLEEMIATNEKLRESNLLMRGRCETLLEDLSVKEAQSSEKEERLKMEVRKQWGERYHEWITKAEKKMEELQQINTMLQAMLKTKQHNPDLQ